MFNTGSSNGVVRGLSIANFQGAGIYIPQHRVRGVTGNLIGWHARRDDARPQSLRRAHLWIRHRDRRQLPVARNLIVSGGESAVKAINTYNMIVEGNLIGVNEDGLLARRGAGGQRHRPQRSDQARASRTT